MADQARNHRSGSCQVDAHDPAVVGQDSTAVAVLTIGGGRCSWRASRNTRALGSLEVTAEAVRQQPGDVTLPAEDGPSSAGISRRMTFTGMAMGMLSGARLEWPQTCHADPGPKRTPEGYPYLWTGEILPAMIQVYRAAVIGVDAAAGPQVPARGGIDLPRPMTKR